MKWQHSNRSEADYRNAPLTVQKAIDKQTRLLAQNLLHPSLHAKKFNESEGRNPQIPLISADLPAFKSAKFAKSANWFRSECPARCERNFGP